MRHWWADTLFKRLFLLMWFGLVASHLLALMVTTRVMHAAPPAALSSGAPGRPGLPVLPSLPPMGIGPQADGPGGPPPELRDLPPGGPPPGRPPPVREGGGLPASALWLDYGIRFLAIGIVAWFGARWLSAPMHRLAAASEGLGSALGQSPARPPLDEAHGTLEVRQTAQVFNTMARRLHAQFDAQRLLMAAISHDLRTPLARLRLRLEAMPAPAETARCIADIHEMNTLVGSVLEMLREQHAEGEMQRVDITALAQALVDDLAEQGAPVSIAPAPQAVVQGRPAALKRLLGNLLDNAVRHGGGARVTVEVGASEVRVRVDDDGPGIAAHELEQAFEPFRRLGPSGAEAAPGSGLGLYIARDLAQRQRGRLTLANRPGGGLRAELALPLA